MAALRSRCGHYFCPVISSLWPPYVIGHAVIFLPFGFFFYLSIFFFFLA